MSETDPPNNENNNPDPIVDIDEDKRREENFSSCSSRTSSSLSRSITKSTLNNSNQLSGSRFVANNFSSAGCRSNVNLLSQNSLNNLNVISQNSLGGSKVGDFCVSGLSLKLENVSLKSVGKKVKGFFSNKSVDKNDSKVSKLNEKFKSMNLNKSDSSTSSNVSRSGGLKNRGSTKKNGSRQNQNESSRLLGGASASSMQSVTDSVNKMQISDSKKNAGSSSKNSRKSKNCMRSLDKGPSKRDLALQKRSQSGGKKGNSAHKVNEGASTSRFNFILYYLFSLLQGSLLMPLLNQ